MLTSEWLVTEGTSELAFCRIVIRLNYQVTIIMITFEDVIMGWTLMWSWEWLVTVRTITWGADFGFILNLGYPVIIIMITLEDVILAEASSSEKLHAPSTCWIQYLGDFCLSIKILRGGTFCTSSLPFMIEQLSCRMLTWPSECPGDGGEECWEEWQGWVVCLLLVLLLSSASLRTDTGDPWVIKGGISRSRSVKEALGEVLVAYFFFKKLLRRLESRLLCEGDFFFLFTWFWAGMGLISDESSEMEKSPYMWAWRKRPDHCD